jgi:hypothetical protein
VGDGRDGGGRSGGGAFGIAPDPGLGMLHTIPMAWSRDLGKLFEKRPYTPDELFVSISNTIKQHKAEVESHKSLYWRAVHLFIRKPDPNTVEIDGMRLRQLTEFFEPERAALIEVGKTYKVRLNELARVIDDALEALSASAEGKAAP